MKLYRYDNWQNTMTGLGRKSTDKQTHNFHGSTQEISVSELTSIYMGDGLGHRIVTTVPADATKNGFNLLGDSEAVLEKELLTKNVISAFKEAGTWARLYGGAVVLMDFKDGREWSAPLNESAPGELRKLRVYPSPRIDLNAMKKVADPKSDHYEDYEHYAITKLDNTAPIIVHRSRLLVFTSAKAPQVKEAQLSPSAIHWGAGILSMVYSTLAPVATTLATIPTLAQESAITVFRLANLAELVASDNYEAIDTRMTAIQLQKSVLNAVLLGEGEEFERNSLSFQGLPDILDRLFSMLATVANIPKSILFGKESAGLSSNQEEDTSRYYDSVISFQTEQLTQPLQRLAELTNIGMGNPVDKAELVALWEHPRPETQVEKLANREKQAGIDNTYINAGVYSADDVARSRFYSGYSYDTTIEDYEPI